MDLNLSQRSSISRHAIDCSTKESPHQPVRLSDIEAEANTQEVAASPVAVEHILLLEEQEQEVYVQDSHEHQPPYPFESLESRIDSEDHHGTGRDREELPLTIPRTPSQRVTFTEYPQTPIQTDMAQPSKRAGPARPAKTAQSTDRDDNATDARTQNKSRNLAIPAAQGGARNSMDVLKERRAAKTSQLVHDETISEPEDNLKVSATRSALIHQPVVTRVSDAQTSNRPHPNALAAVGQTYTKQTQRALEDQNVSTSKLPPPSRQPVKATEDSSDDANDVDVSEEGPPLYKNEQSAKSTQSKARTSASRQSNKQNPKSAKSIRSDFDDEYTEKQTAKKPSKKAKAAPTTTGRSLRSSKRGANAAQSKSVTGEPEGEPPMNGSKNTHRAANRQLTKDVRPATKSKQNQDESHHESIEDFEHAVTNVAGIETKKHDYNAPRTNRHDEDRGHTENARVRNSHHVSANDIGEEASITISPHRVINNNENVRGEGAPNNKERVLMKPNIIHFSNQGPENQGRLPDTFDKSAIRVKEFARNSAQPSEGVNDRETPTQRNVARPFDNDAAQAQNAPSVLESMLTQSMKRHRRTPAAQEYSEEVQTTEVQFSVDDHVRPVSHPTEPTFMERSLLPGPDLSIQPPSIKQAKSAQVVHPEKAKQDEAVVHEKRDQAQIQQALMSRDADIFSTTFAHATLPKQKHEKPRVANDSDSLVLLKRTLSQVVVTDDGLPKRRKTDVPRINNVIEALPIMREVMQASLNGMPNAEGASGIFDDLLPEPNPLTLIPGENDEGEQSVSPDSRRPVQHRPGPQSGPESRIEVIKNNPPHKSASPVIDHIEDDAATEVEFEHQPVESFVSQMMRERLPQTRGEDAVAEAEVHASESDGQDMDTTLVEEDAAYMTDRYYNEDDDSTTSSESTSGEAEADDDSTQVDPLMAWREELCKHQASFFDHLVIIAHELTCHLVDKEDAIQRLMNQYENGGVKIIEGLDARYKKDVDESMQQLVCRSQKMATALRQGARTLKQDQHDIEADKGYVAKIAGQRESWRDEMERLMDLSE